MIKDNFLFQLILLNEFSFKFCIANFNAMLFLSFLYQQNHKKNFNLHYKTIQTGFSDMYLNVNRPTMFYVMSVFICSVQMRCMRIICLYDYLNGIIAILIHHFFEPLNGYFQCWCRLSQLYLIKITCYEEMMKSPIPLQKHTSQINQLDYAKEVKDGQQDIQTLYRNFAPYPTYSTNYEKCLLKFQEWISL